MNKAVSSPFHHLISVPSAGDVQIALEHRLTNRGRHLNVALGYRRCKDFDARNHPGQDFALTQWDERFVIGVLADGVSQSFFGNLAAEWLTRAVGDLLWTLRAEPPDADRFSRHLQDLSSHVDPEVQQMRIPRTLPPMQIEALERARLKGSQAVIGAFCLDLHRSSAALFQIGDVTAVVLDGERRVRTIISDAKGRWSTTGHAHFHLRTETLHTDALLLKSDGIGSGWGQELGTDFGLLQSFESMADAAAEVDDVSFVLAAVLPHRLVAPARAPRAPITENRPDPQERDVPRTEQADNPAAPGRRFFQPIVSVIKKIVELEEAASRRSSSRAVQLGQQLGEAILAGDRDAIRRCLSRWSPDVDGAYCNGSPPLIYAIKARDEELVRELLVHDADPRVLDEAGNSALLLAANTSFPAAVRLLLRYDAPVNQRNSIGETALLLAVRAGDEAIVTMLLDWGANPNLPNRYGHTPLTVGAELGRSTLVQLLLRAGGDPERATSSGDYPITLAQRGNHLKVVEILQRAISRERG
jgi:hypothetical protein